VTVIHVASLLRDLIRDGRLKPEIPVKARVAYHRSVLPRPAQWDLRGAPRSAQGESRDWELVELSRHHEDSLCCGGGGGRMWSDTPWLNAQCAEINDAARWASSRWPLPARTACSC